MGTATSIMFIFADFWGFVARKYYIITFLFDFFLAGARRTADKIFIFDEQDG